MKKMTFEDKKYYENIEICENLRWSTDEEIKKFIDEYADKHSEGIKQYIEMHASIHAEIEGISIYDYYSKKRQEQFEKRLKKIEEIRRDREQQQ